MNDADRQRLESLIRKRDYRQAEQLVQERLGSAAEDEALWFMLARIDYYTGRPQQALEHCSKAASIRPQWIEPVYLAGLVYRSTGNTAHAESAWKHVLSWNPRHLHAGLQLAALYAESGQQPAAIQHYRSALEIAPDDTTILCNLGRVLHEAGSYEEALQMFRRAIALEPDRELFYVNLAYTCQALENYADALRWYREARRINPQSASAVAGEANILHRTGQTGAAIDLVRECLPDNRDHIPLVTLYLNLARAHGEVDQAITLAEEVLDTPGVANNETVQLLFALASAHDLSGNHRVAFRCVQQANDRVNSRYDPEAHHARVQDVISFFSSGVYESMPRSSLETHTPLFIVGMPRSGTSLVEQILASHASIFAAGETQYIHRLAGALDSGAPESGYPGCLQGLDGGALTDHARQYLDTLRKYSRSAARLTDKTPHNYLHLPFITMLFPNARIIHCRRHPLDTCLSCFFRQFAGGNEYSYNQEYLARHYADYLEMMECWRDLGIPMLEVRYEQLVQDQEYWSRKIIEYSGLEWDQNCLEFYKTGRAVPSASFDQVNRPLYGSSVLRWKKYTDQLEPMRAILEEQVAEYEAGLQCR